ncbi:hypothetical protein [Streptomyces sp900116325]|uniref:hypothetical protein n=1 Tax=Streptomyces sp. 900116325 TaxID=3154295 RepID=UPI0033A362C5
MVESEIAERMAARRAELDELEEQLVKPLDQVRAERDELAVAERVWHRMAEQFAGEQATATPVPVQVAGRAVLLVPHREGGMDQTVLPPEYQKILAVVRQAGAQVATRAVGEALGLEVGVRGRLEPLRGKLTKLAERGWLRKMPDVRFTTRPWPALLPPAAASWASSWRNCGAPGGR